jgi:hypothetical protein
MQAHKHIPLQRENTYPIVGGAPVTLTSGGGCATAMWLCGDGARGKGNDTCNKIQNSLRKAVTYHSPL